MTHSEILTKAIEKAMGAGWSGTRFTKLGGDWMGVPPKLEVVSPFGTDAWFVYTTGGVDNKDIEVQPEHIIFNHDFARALWGEHLPDVDWEATDRERGWFGVADGVSGYAEYDGPNWEYHLQQMVIADDPIEYLGAHL